LINSLLLTNIAKENKKPGKTQRLEFFLISKKNENRIIIIDAPGFGWVEGPVILKRKFKYLIYSFLNYSVRLSQIVYLLNGEYGMMPLDKAEIKFLNNFNKDIQLVFTKVDKLNNIKLVKFISEASNFTKNLKNVKREILITSSKTKYGISDLRTKLFIDLANKNKLNLI
jgi:GTP-binding protein